MAPFDLDVLLARDEFGLTLATEPQSGCSNVVFGAHSIETDDPARWLDPGWIILTDGSLLHSPLDQQEFILRAQRAGLCGVGLAAGIHFDHPPAQLVATANSVGLPVFIVPESIPFHRLVRFVDRELLARELRELQELVRMQALLIDSTQGNGGEPSPVVQSLARLLGADAEVFDGGVSLDQAKRTQLTRSCVPPVFTDREYADSAAGRFVLPLRSPRSPAGWLSITWPAAHVVSRSERELLRLAGGLIQIQRAAAADRLARLDRYRKRLVEMLVDRHDDGASSAELAGELAAQGLDIGTGARVIFVARTEHMGVFDPNSLDVAGNVVLWSQIDDGCVLVCGSSGWRRIADAVAGSQSHGVGVSSEFVRVTDGARACEQARVLTRVRHISNADGEAAYACADDVSLSMQLALQVDSGVARQLAESVLRPVSAHPELIETLQCWMKVGRDITATGQQLFLHPNSVRYRLRRLEELLGRPLADASTLSDLYIATLIVDA